MLIEKAAIANEFHLTFVERLELIDQGIEKLIEHLVTSLILPHFTMSEQEGCEPCSYNLVLLIVSLEYL